MKLYTVPTQLVPELWPEASALLKRALKHHPFVDEESLLMILLAGRASLIVAVEDDRLISAAIMERFEYPKTIVGNVLALAGEKGTYEHMDQIMDFLEKWCREKGCEKITELGRPGWSRLAKRRGYQFKAYAQAWKDL